MAWPGTKKAAPWGYIARRRGLGGPAQHPIFAALALGLAHSRILNGPLLIAKPEAQLTAVTLPVTRSDH